MALNNAQAARLEEIVDAVFGNTDRLNQADQEFLADIQSKYHNYGDNLNLSLKQWDWLERILSKVS